MAFVSSNPFKLREKADAGDPAAKRILSMKEKPQLFLTSVLIGNNIVNVAAAALLTYGFKIHFDIENEWAVTAIIVPILIIFGEILPKDYCRSFGGLLLLRYVDILSFFLFVLRLPAKIMLLSVDKLLHFFKAKTDKTIFVSEEEFRMLIEESSKTGVIHVHEKQLIDMILDFEREKVESVMIPIEKVPVISIFDKIKDAKALARETQTKMILVYEEIPQITVGMIYVFDFLFEEDETQNLKKYLRSPLFIPHSMSLEKAFLLLQQMRQSYAAVTDDAGEVAGVVPIESLLVPRA